MIINHNANALNTYNRLAAVGKSKANAMDKLSSGVRINKAADDVAGATISQKMKAQIRGLEQASRNIQDGISLVQTAEAGLGSIQNPNLQRMRELMLQALNETLTQQDRMQIQNELENVKASIDDIANNTEFNTTKVLTKPIHNNQQPTPQPTNLDIIFMVDHSGSMRGSSGPINVVKDGIEEFLNKISGNIDTKIAIVSTVDKSPYDYMPFTGDKNVIKSKIESYVTQFENSGTMPYDTFSNSMPDGTIGSKLGYRDGSKKIFIMFTDTGNESGTLSQDNAKDRLEGPNIQLGNDNDDIQTYVFGVGDNGFYDSYYKDITDFTGGKIYRPLTSADISDKLINDLAQDIKDSIPPSTPQQDDEMPILKLQVGANSGELFKVELFDARTKNLGIDDVKVDPIEEAEKALQKVDKAIELVSIQRSKFGAYQNALEHIATNVDNYEYNLSAAESRISDADMAKEVMEMTKNSIIEQSAQAMLQQSQKMSESIMNLIDKWQGTNSN